MPRGTSKLQTRLLERACDGCGKQFKQARPMQVVCSGRCAGKLMADMRKADRAHDKARKLALMTHGDWVKAAQKEFNAYIRLRDAGKPCICCGKPMGADRPGGAVDAGHYLSIGSNPQHRFTEINVNAQRKSCNKPGGTTRATFRAGMVERYGEAAVAALEADHAPRQYKIHDLIAIRDDYRARVRLMRKEAA